MNQVKVDQFVHCKNNRRGLGKEPVSPVRIVEEIFTFDGELVAEKDPYGNITVEQIFDFLEWNYKDTDKNTHKENIVKFFMED